ncbi:MAG: iron ABC transporter permease [Phycisphaeraceae bacterium]|nr:iron ABC transporter permease [Phycisphaeraceae bacterium]
MTAKMILLAGVMLAAGGLRLFVGQELGWPAGGCGAGLWKLLVGGWASQWWPGVFEEPGAMTWMDIRLLRVVSGAVVGAGLAASGVALQALLRNAPAEPFILGLSSGAAVGVMGQALLAYGLGMQLGANHIGALLGAGLSMAIVFAAGRRHGVIDPLGLLLTGVVLSTINGAVVMMLNYLVGPGGLRENLSYWMMGNIDEAVSSGTLVMVLGVTVAGIGVMVKLGRAMDVLTFSEAEAISLGVRVGALRAVLFLMASVMAAGAVVLAGPIAFVGLICPHVVRFLLGPGHRALVIGSALVGATLILLADVASVLLDRGLGSGQMPIGVFTAMIGGPVFLWILRPQMGRGQE